MSMLREPGSWHRVEPIAMMWSAAARSVNFAALR